ncbi:MAG: bifunctional glutamate N-acetyltransferase/amino-acid acetyltransferase ArgJ [Gammaproteobacteria bacterium]|tara:strand:- start:20154 stop:21365 length:1212 start_codon:yes stop_codon:yes gene_type:complete
MLKKKDIKIYPVEGIKLGSVHSKMYQKRRYDLSIIELCKNTIISGVFTNNKVKAAPVLITQKHIKNKNLKYLIVNAGNANAGTGVQGINDIKKYCKKLSDISSCAFENILIFSTGVIGERIKVDNINKAIPILFKKLKQDNWLNFSKSILTTDTCIKLVSKKIQIKNEPVVITGVAKGSGMIMPNMATMLSFVATNLKISKKELDKMLIRLTEKSYNMITVDGDTSTNDSSILISSGKSKINYKQLNSREKSKFDNCIESLYQELAKKIIKDAEGATKFITINIKKAKNKNIGKNVGMSIANSSLVKTALFAEDPNWGRILSAIGNSNIDKSSISNLEIYIGKYLVFKNNKLYKKYNESLVARYLKNKNIDLNIFLNNGKYNITVWTSDLTYQYIKINAEYRT